jgi:hypothetical protein
VTDRGDRPPAPRVWCRYCTEYPARSKQPGSGMCVEATSGRSLDSRPCEPKLTASGRLRRLFGMRIG